MAGNPKQKIKLLCVLDILKEFSDEDHPIDATSICDKLKSEYDITAERKSIYDDIAILEDYGVDIIKTRVPKFGYFIGYRDFDVPEISLLVDAVESANFITQKKTKQLVEKLGKLVSQWQAKDINKQVYIDNRNKCTNEEIFYSIDKINSAIKNSQKISFTYIRRSLGDNKRISETLKEMTVSPYALVWESDHYYLIGNVEKYENLIHLRLDRMKGVKVLNAKSRHFSEVSEYKTFFDVADYVRKSFNMYGGELKNIELKCNINKLEQVIDRFGDKLYLRPDESGSFTFTTKANISEGLIGWLLQFDNDIEVVSPIELRNSIIERIERIRKVYK